MHVLQALLGPVPVRRVLPPPLHAGALRHAGPRDAYTQAFSDADFADLEEVFTHPGPGLQRSTRCAKTR